MTFEEIDAALPLLAESHVNLTLAWPASDLDNPARWELVRKANRLGVRVDPWLVLDFQDGYWPGSTNAAVFVPAARALLAAWKRERLAPSTLIVDMEMPLARVQQYSALLFGGDAQALLGFLASGINRAQYAEATALYARLVDDAHRQRFEVELNTWGQVLDDYADGDDGLRQAFNTPVAGIAWDRLTFQAYRTLSEPLVAAQGLSLSSYYVYSYAASARALFGARAGIFVGMTNGGDFGGTAPVYSDPSQLIEDLAAVRAAGVGRAAVGVYNLLGIVERPPSAAWLVRPTGEKVVPPADSGTAFIRQSTVQLDQYL